MLEHNLHNMLSYNDIDITAAVRLIGSFVYIMGSLRAPRAALGQPKSSQELQEQPLAGQEPPRGHFPNLIEKPYESHETSLKKSKKHCARATSDQLLTIYAPKTLKNELKAGSSGSPGSCGSGAKSRGSEPPHHAPGVRMTGRFN